jgi:TIR domain
MNPDMVFVSYSRQDKRWLQRFKKIFKPLRRYADVNLWSDEQIESGTNGKEAIVKAMDKAFVAVLLVSAIFLNSDFIANEELPFILKAAITEL